MQTIIRMNTDWWHMEMDLLLICYMFSTVTPQKRKIRLGSCHSWTTDWPITTIIWSTLCSRCIIQLDSPTISFTKSTQWSYSIALDFLNSAMCRLPNSTPLRITLFALFRNLIQNFIPHVQDLIKLFGNSRPIQPASSIQSSDIKNDRTTMVDNHAAKPRAGTNGTWL
jgi:hypothetical protein